MQHQRPRVIRCVFVVFLGMLVAITMASVDSSFGEASTQAEEEPPFESAHIQVSIRNGSVRSRGVNLGGWLVAEHWMTPDAEFWEGIELEKVNSGEYTAITKAQNPETVRVRLGEHHATFITKDDVEQIAAAGLNTMRVPLGFWIVGYDNHDPANQREWEAYTRGTLVYLDRLIRSWARTYNVAVLISLHAAKGSQNGADHSSPANPGHSYWSQFPENVANSVEVARFLADRYKHDEAFLGIGLLNEPSGATDQNVLYQYYRDAYQAVRATGSDCVLSVMPLLHKQGPDEMVGFMEGPQFQNVWVEWHPYFIWGYENIPDDQIVDVAIKQQYQARVDKWNSRPGHNHLFVGEWSMATASNMHANDPDRFYAFAAEQLKVHNQAEGGWAMWTWKTADDRRGFHGWSMRSVLADQKLAELLYAAN